MKPSCRAGPWGSGGSLLGLKWLEHSQLMEPPQPSAWDWLAIDRAPQPPDLSQIGSPEALTAYLVG